MNITGLSKKAIRFYETKGLLTVSRRENGYRYYSDDNIKVLKKIKFLRSCGVSVPDIKLLFSGIITIDELIKKRKKEIENEYGHYSEVLSDVSDAFENYQKDEYDLNIQFEETAESIPLSDKLILGIDIGSTTISAAVIDLENPEHTEAYNIPNNSALSPASKSFYEQDAEKIYSDVLKLTELIISSYPNIKSIGVTGQMHGILYTDKDGNAISPLYTWQDKRADEKFCGNLSYCDKIFKITGKTIFSGFGFATHFYNTKNGLLPSNAHSFCSIMDYIVMKLTNSNLPIIHTSVAASFGLFDINSSVFDLDAIKKLGLHNITLPQITVDYTLAGKYKSYPVSVAIGDNQASFIGSVRDIDNTILVNIGTGSQISYLSDTEKPNNDLELRPLAKDKFILCGSALCGGKAYAILEKFFKSFATSAFSNTSSQYTVLNNLAEDAYKSGQKPLDVNTTFCGKRGNPGIFGSILDITEDNFTPGQLALGFIYGICRELHEFIDKNTDKNIVVASGNAVRKIPIMKNVLEDIFNMPVLVSYAKEEASVGAALFSASASGYYCGIYETSEFINYERK